MGLFKTFLSLLSKEITSMMHENQEDNEICDVVPEIDFSSMMKDINSHSIVIEEEVANTKDKDKKDTIISVKE